MTTQPSPEPEVSSAEPGLLHTIGVWGGLVVGGIGAGSGLVWLLAPGAALPQFVGFMTLPLVFGFGLKAWYAAVAAAGTKRLIGTVLDVLLRRRDFAEAAHANFADWRGRVPGTGVFLPIGLGAGFLAGVLTWLPHGSAGFQICVGAWIVLAGGYALFMRWLARTGRLPLPESA